MTKIRALTEQEETAIQAFAHEFGRTWKSQLTDVYWYNARLFTDAQGVEHSCLHALRNDPRWAHAGLAAYRLPKGFAFGPSKKARLAAARRRRKDAEALDDFNYVGSRHHY